MEDRGEEKKIPIEGTSPLFFAMLEGMNRVSLTYAVSEYPLAQHTLYRIGGPAAVALLPENAEEALEAYEWMLTQPPPHLILGGGSNVLISDAGFPGVVLCTQGLQGVEALGGDRYRVESGVVLQRLVRDVMLPNNYAGVGALTGIPGSVGGAIFMNAGTVNGATGEFLESVSVVGKSGGRTHRVTEADLRYRKQSLCAPGELLLGGIFRFCRADTDQEAVYSHYMQRRRETQPQGYCCGSVFKNPKGEHAGRLIEACGLKGTRRGGAVISPKHANFIMNDQQASFDDVMGLIELAKATVRERFGIVLEEEVRIIRDTM